MTNLTEKFAAKLFVAMIVVNEFVSLYGAQLSALFHV